MERKNERAREKERENKKRKKKENRTGAGAGYHVALLQHRRVLTFYALSGR